ncbi:MAG: AI-2E family transporter [Bacteroidia bacterium]
MFLKNKSTIILLLTLICVAAFVFIFTKIVIYMLIAIILSLLAEPFIKLYSKIRFKSKHLPDAVIALLSLLSMLFLFLSFFYAFVPLIIDQVKFISTLNFNDVFTSTLNHFPNLKAMLVNIGAIDDLSKKLNAQLATFLNVGNASYLLNHFLSAFGGIVGGALVVCFITFFLLKDRNLTGRSLLLITPVAYEHEMTDILRTTKSLLSKYFVALFIDVLMVTILVGTSLALLGVRNAFFIAAFAGIMNIIPYLGPIISFAFACFLGVTGCMEANETFLIGNVIEKIFWVLLSVNVFDGFLMQPYLFSNSVKAHPLEIFIVILMASSLAGVGGMIIAIPTYTLIRIVAKEFLANYKFFKKLTENIPE